MTDARNKERRSSIIQLIVGLVLLAFLFGVLLPSLIDYGTVWEVIRSLEAWQLALLAFLGVLRLISEALLYSAVIPDLGVKAGIQSYLASNTVAEVAPPPADLAARFGMYKSLGIDTEPAGIGIILSGFFSMGARLVIPVIALILVVASGPADEEIWFLTAIGLAAVIGLAAFATLIMRSEKLTRKVGAWTGRTVTRLTRRFKKPIDGGDLGTQAVGFRDRIKGTLSDRWPHATVAVAFSHIWSYLIVLAAFRFIGIPNSEVGWVDLLVAYAIVRLITLIPLTPGGIGVAAVGYIWLLGAGGNQDAANLIAAASFLTRIFVWLLPLVVGIPPLLSWRKSAKHHGDPATA